MTTKKERIFIDAKDETNKIRSYTFKNGRCIIVFEKSDREFSYSAGRVQVVRNVLSGTAASNVFNYLKEVAEEVGLKTEKGDNILAKSFAKIKFVPEQSILSVLLDGKLPASTSKSERNFFPFGFNLSQLEAVEKAATHPLSVIEGPPGTGKTQTILNIIANAILDNKTVAVVSSNNSATKNVYEKLQKNGIEFIAALLGNSENKKEFIESQEEIPDLSSYSLTQEQKNDILHNSTSLLDLISQKLIEKNELAGLRLQIDNFRTEYRHFKESQGGNGLAMDPFGRSITAEQILSLWYALEELQSRGGKVNFFRRLFYRFKYRIKNQAFFGLPIDQMIVLTQSHFYRTKIQEIENRMQELEASLADFQFDAQLKNYTEMSMQLLKAKLFERFGKKSRKIYAMGDLTLDSAQFLQDYPVVMSTTYSLRQCLSTTTMYDYVIIDEASQVDLVTGALALSCAKKAVVVGDLKQLPNVVSEDMKAQTDTIFQSYNLPQAYSYADNSLLSCILELVPHVPKTLLREHYRCHPKIIEFCNKKFYDDQLIVHTQYAGERTPLVVYKTAPGNHARERMNQRQIDVIQHEIIPNEKLEGVDMGIVTPYRNQTNAIKSTLGEQLVVDTVDKFQGRENDVIILSTVDNEITDFTDNANRLNVAISRAIKQLVLVVNGNEQEKDSNIKDLIQYIEYNNFTIVQSELNSIFDMLYKGYEAEREKIIRRSGKISEYDSENLMYSLIKEVLSQEKFSKYDVLVHFPAGKLIKDFSKLNPEEIKYITNPATHFDFVIYNKLGKTPVLAVEVDGFNFHKQGSRQAERDDMKDGIFRKFNFPVLRFRTDESNEREKLTQKLLEVQQ